MYGSTNMYGYGGMDRNISATTTSSVVTNQPYSSKIPLPHAYPNQYTEPVHKRSASGYVTDSGNSSHPSSVFESLHTSRLSPDQKRERLLAILHRNQAKLRPWNSGLCKCHKNRRHCLLQLLLGPIYQGCQAERVGEDFFTGCCMGSIFGLPITCLPCISASAMVSLRAKIRERHNILGAICDDWLLYICCLGNCASCQFYRELDDLGYPPSLI